MRGGREGRETRGDYALLRRGPRWGKEERNGFFISKYIPLGRRELLREGELKETFSFFEGGERKKGRDRLLFSYL